MAEESLSTEWSNWTTVIRNLIELPFLIFAFKYIRKRIDERHELCNRIGEKYYSCMTIVKNVRWEAAKVNQDSEEHLRTANTLLNKFHSKIQCIPNNGSVADVEIGEIRKMFSSKAAECVCKIQELIDKLDGMGKEPSSWKDICSTDVIGYSDRILCEWESLLKIMAHKCWMKVSTLKREYDEKANGA